MDGMEPQIAVIGGGPAGLATGLNLKKSGFSVTILEAENYTQVREGEHLDAEAKLEFASLGIPDDVWLPSTLPCTEVRNIWGRPDLHRSPSIFNPYGHEFILTRPEFDYNLAMHCRSLGIPIHTEFRVAKVERKTEKWQIIGKHGEELVTDFLVDASGRNSKFQALFGGRGEPYDQLVGITKRIPNRLTEALKSSYLLLEPVELGWWYSVQLRDGTLIVTLMTDADIPHLSGVSQDEFWQQALEKSVYTRARVGTAEIPKATMTRSARTQRLPKLYGQACLAVGDAAMSYDPLSSAGIMKGFRMGKKAAEAIAGYYANDHNALANYQHSADKQFSNYLKNWGHYYQQQIRWGSNPFWYRRNLKPSEIAQFLITPSCLINLSTDVRPEQLAFLNKSLPEVDFSLLFRSLRETQPVAEAIRKYLIAQGQTTINQSLLQALEAMRLMGIIAQQVEETKPK